MLYTNNSFKTILLKIGNQVKLPGPAQDKPNVYEFGTTYEEMYKDLLSKDKNLYDFWPLDVIHNYLIL